MLVAFLALCALLYVFSDHHAFAGQANIVNVVRQISMLGILSIGIGFVIITGGIDLSIGSMVGLTGVLIAYFAVPKEDGGRNWNIYGSIGAALTIAMLIGLVQGLLITRLKLQPFIVTLGTMLTLRGVSQTICEGSNISLANIPFANFADSGIFEQHGDARLQYPAIIFIGVILIAAYVLHFTVFGRYVYAIGGNRDAAEYSGINVRVVETSTYVISAGLAGVAAICYGPYIGQMSQKVGESYELYAITAAVLGGCSLRGGEGTVLGIVIGTCVMKVIDNGIDVFRVGTWKPNDNWKNIILGGTPAKW